MAGMIPIEAVEGQLYYDVVTPDGSRRPTSVPDTTDNRFYLGFAHRAPLAHQVRDFARFKDLAYFALFYEQRARKTKVNLDVFRYRADVVGDVDALVVVAYPNGVHRGWLEELALDFPPEALARTRVLAWTSGKTDSKRGREEALALRDHLGPIVVTINSEAVARSKTAFKYLEWLLARRRVMLTADESSFMANWTAITKKMLALSRRPTVIVRSILDGTPVEEGPGEIYFQAKFLRDGLLGFTTKEAFKARYFEYEEEDVPEVVDGVPTGVVVRQRIQKQRHGPGGRVLSTYEVFKGYRNLEELYGKIETFASRVRRADVSDAPEKTYQTRYFDLTERQRRVYDELRDRYASELSGREVTVANVLLRMTRLQMVARNYYPPERTGEPCSACDGTAFTDDGTACPDCDGIGVRISVSELQRIDPDRNPAIEAVVEELRASRSPAVVWCRFRQDVLDVVTATRRLGLHYFRYDGGVPAADRETGYRTFRAGEGDGIVATIRSGIQRGHDLTRAGLSIYYSNEWGLRHRRQSEDRTEGLDRRTSTDVVDLVATDTRDIDVINALRSKRDVASLIMGDPPTRWL